MCVSVRLPLVLGYLVVQRILEGLNLPQTRESLPRWIYFISFSNRDTGIGKVGTK